MAEQRDDELAAGEVTADLVRQQFDVREDKIRDAAKWLIASFAAVGAALIAGSQLSSIGKLPLCFDQTLECSRLWVAVLGTLASLLGVVFAIWIGVRLLIPDRLQADALRKESARERKFHWKKKNSYLKTYFQDNDTLLQRFASLDDMEHQVSNAYKEVERLKAELRTAPERSAPRIQAELDEADEHLADVLSRSDVVVSTANHALFVNDFKSSSLRKLMLAGSITALGIVAFAWAANPPASSLAASLHGADLTGANLTGTNLRNVDLSGANLSDADLTEADLKGAQLTDAELDGVVWDNTVCPDGTSSDDAADSCLNHLEPQT
jgi:Pentapeptide repeats (8 copies)